MEGVHAGDRKRMMQRQGIYRGAQYGLYGVGLVYECMEWAQAGTM